MGWKDLARAFFNDADDVAASPTVRPQPEKRSSSRSDFVRNAQFREALNGYDPSRVDSLLERIIQDLDAGIRPTVRIGVDLGKKFRGYNREDVDELLARVRAD